MYRQEASSIKNLKKGYFFVLYLLIAVFLFFREIKFSEIVLNTVLNCVWPVIFSTLFAFVILEQVYAGRPFFKMGKINHFNVFGRYTYFSYVFHYHIFLVTLFLSYLFFGYRIANPDWGHYYCRNCYY